MDQSTKDNKSALESLTIPVRAVLSLHQLLVELKIPGMREPEDLAKLTSRRKWIHKQIR